MKRYAQTLLESFGQRSVFVQKVCGAKTGLSHTSATVAAPWACGGNSGVFVECGGRDIDILTWVYDSPGTASDSEAVMTIFANSPPWPELKVERHSWYIAPWWIFRTTRCRRCGRALRMELAPALPLILADRVQLQQVILNLSLNGIEAMRPIVNRPRELVIRSEEQVDAL
jgi:hypothetical protein